MNSRKTFYTDLNVAESASAQTIKKAYYRLAQAHHPDKNRDNRHYDKQIFLDVATAYQVLSDSDQRKLYNDYLHGNYDCTWNEYLNSDKTPTTSFSDFFSGIVATFASAKKFYEEMFRDYDEEFYDIQEVDIDFFDDESAPSTVSEKPTPQRALRLEAAPLTIEKKLVFKHNYNDQLIDELNFYYIQTVSRMSSTSDDTASAWIDLINCYSMNDQLITACDTSFQYLNQKGRKQLFYNIQSIFELVEDMIKRLVRKSRHISVQTDLSQFREVLTRSIDYLELLDVFRQKYNSAADFKDYLNTFAKIHTSLLLNTIRFFNEAMDKREAYADTVHQLLPEFEQLSALVDIHGINNAMIMSEHEKLNSLIREKRNVLVYQQEIPAEHEVVTMDGTTDINDQISELKQTIETMIIYFDKRSMWNGREKARKLKDALSSVNDHDTIEEAIEKVKPALKWQRWCTHFQENRAAPKHSLKVVLTQFNKNY